MTFRLIHGDCREAMAAIDASSIDAIVTDPPYGLSFMGKAWDHGVPGEPFWSAALRVAKPGAYLVAFGGTRTYHRLTVAIEDAGWEIRDCLTWLYGQGFPKSLDVSKAIDKAAGAERGPGVPGRYAARRPRSEVSASAVYHDGVGDLGSALVTAPATDTAHQWSGWGTALKPAWEPIILARKPIAGTVAANVQEHGTGALNVDGCRIGVRKDVPASSSNANNNVYGRSSVRQPDRGGMNPNLGRWPANVLLECSCLSPRLVCLESPYAGDIEANVAYARRAMADSLRRGELPIASHLLYTQPGILRDEVPGERALGIEAGLAWGELADATVAYMDRGTSRGMDAAIKRAQAEGRAVIRRWLDEGREELEHAVGCAVAILDEQSGELVSGANPTRRGTDKFRGVYQGFEGQRECKAHRGLDVGGASRFFYTSKASPSERHYAGKNGHPTVKPVDLMRWLCRLVTPPGGIVLDPFMGSGSTGIAAQAEGFGFIGCDTDPESVATARRRIAGPLFASAEQPQQQRPAPEEEA